MNYLLLCRDHDLEDNEDIYGSYDDFEDDIYQDIVHVKRKSKVVCNLATQRLLLIILSHQLHPPSMVLVVVIVHLLSVIMSLDAFN